MYIKEIKLNPDGKFMAFFDAAYQDGTNFNGSMEFVAEGLATQINGNIRTQIAGLFLSVIGKTISQNDIVIFGGPT